MCMRTNIVIDDELLREALEYSHARTKRGLIEEALHTYIRIKAVEKKRENYVRRLTDIRERLAGVRLRQSPAELLREDRDRR